MRQGDIYLVDLDPSKGKEQKGQRPVFIVSRDEFNKVTGLPIVLPITSGGEFSRNRGFTVSLSGMGLASSGVILCNQIRTLDIKARNGKFKEHAPDELIEEVLATMIPIFDGDV